MTFLINPFFTVAPTAPGVTSNVQVSIDAIGLTLPFTPVVGRTLVAIGFGYASAPGVDGSWTEITDAQHNPAVLDPGIRAAYQLQSGSPTAAVQPFTGNHLSNNISLAVFEIAGLDPTWTPTYVGTDKNYTLFGGHNASVSDTNSGATGILIAAGFQYLGGGDPGVPTLTMTGGATSIGTANGHPAVGGQSIAGGYVAWPAGGSVTTAFDGNTGGGCSVCVIGLRPA